MRVRAPRPGLDSTRTRGLVWRSENVKAFCDNVRLLGVPDCENFETGDLFEANNMKQVIISINSCRPGALNALERHGPVFLTRIFGQQQTGSSLFLV